MARIVPPVVLYDDRCRLCTRFARTVDGLARGRLTIVGHYTEQGRRIREGVLYPSATEMFWVVGRRTAHGGRAALLPLLAAILTARGGLGMVGRPRECADSCSVLVRSASLLSRSRRVEYESVDAL